MLNTACGVVAKLSENLHPNYTHSITLVDRWAEGNLEHGLEHVVSNLEAHSEWGTSSLVDLESCHVSVEAILVAVTEGSDHLAQQASSVAVVTGSMLTHSDLHQVIQGTRTGLGRYGAAPIAPTVQRARQCGRCRHASKKHDRNDERGRAADTPGRDQIQDRCSVSRDRPAGTSGLEGIPGDIDHYVQQRLGMANTAESPAIIGRSATEHALSLAVSQCMGEAVRSYRA